MRVAIVQMSFDGSDDKVIDRIETNNCYIVEDYMKENGYKLIKDSGLYFRKGRKIRYAYHIPDGVEINSINTHWYKYQELIAKRWEV